MPLITAIRTENWLGLPALAIALGNFTLIAAPNARGKTSLLQAVNFGLFGIKPRAVGTVAELPALLTRGADKGAVEIQIEGRDVRRSITTGALIGKVAVPALPPLAPWILDPATFSSKEPAERRKVLSALLEVKSSPDAIAELLTKAGLPASIVAELKTELQKGFAHAEKHATKRAAEARGAWKNITGENYGAVKAADWQPEPRPVPTEAERVEAIEALAATNGQINGLNQAIGAASRNMDAATREQLTATAAKLPEWQEAQSRGQTQLAALQARVATLEPASQGNSGITTPCPHCAKLVVIDGPQLRVPSEVPADVMLQAHADLRHAREDIATCEANLRKCATGITNAQAAAARLAAEPAPSEGEDIDALRRQLADKTARAETLRALTTMHANQVSAAAAIADSALRAAVEHQKVLDYVKAAEKLSPDGIPSILVAQVLEPVNVVLAEAALGMVTPAIRIDADMVLWFGDTPYPLASESEQWRLDAAMAYALSKLAGLPVLMLDRLDVLVDAGDANRANVLRWLYTLSQAGRQVIVAGSFKEAPTIPGTVWLDGAVTGQLAAA